MRSVFLIILFLLSSCKQYKSILKNDISWKIYVSKDSCFSTCDRDTCWYLKSIFTSAQDKTIIFDRSGIDTWIAINHGKSIDVNIDLLKKLLSKLDRSQILIENEQSCGVFETENYIMPQTGGYATYGAGIEQEIHLDTIRLSAGLAYGFDLGIYRSQDLKISSKSDSVFRFHYIYRPDKIHRRNGFKPILITSDWFVLPKYKK